MASKQQHTETVKDNTLPNTNETAEASSATAAGATSESPQTDLSAKPKVNNDSLLFLFRLLSFFPSLLSTANDCWHITNDRLTNDHRRVSCISLPIVILQHDVTTTKKDNNKTNEKSDQDRFWELLYDSDYNNPVIHHLCESGIELITLANKQRETCDLLLTLDDLLPTHKRARVEHMIKMAKTLGKSRFSTTDIRHFYYFLAPQDQTVTDDSRRSRRRKCPRHQQQQQQQEGEEDNRGGEI